jgi:IclR family acetate operon transcriptional repressor
MPVRATKPATTITKVCRVLSEFRSRPSIGVTDLARRTELLPSDVHRILTSLQSYGYIEQDPTTKTYRLGVGFLKLGLTAFQRSEVREAAMPCLQRLSQQLEASTHLAIFDRRELDIFLVEQVDPPAEVAFQPRLGATTSAHCTALGKTIMANMDRELAIQLLKKNGMPRTTHHTITKLAVLEDELERIRQQGYGLDIEESIKGACCIGAPVLDAKGATIGAISASMMASRFYRSHEPQLAALVKAAASELSLAIGYQPRTIKAMRG